MDRIYINSVKMNASKSSSKSHLLLEIFLVFLTAFVPTSLYLKFYGIGMIGRNIGSLAYIKIAQALLDYGFLGYNLDRLIDILHYTFLYLLFKNDFLYVYSYEVILLSITYVVMIVILSRYLFDNFVLRAIFIISCSWIVYWDAQIIYEAAHTNTLLTFLFACALLWQIKFLQRHPHTTNLNLKIMILLLTLPLVDRLMLAPLLVRVLNLISSNFYLNVVRLIFHLSILLVTVAIIFCLKNKKDLSYNIILAYIIAIISLFLSDLVGLFIPTYLLFSVLFLVLLDKFKRIKIILLYFNIISLFIISGILFRLFSIPQYDLLANIYGLSYSPEISFHARLKSLTLYVSEAVIFISMLGGIFSISSIISSRNKLCYHKLLLSSGLFALLLLYFSPEGWFNRFRIYFPAFFAYNFTYFILVLINSIDSFLTKTKITFKLGKLKLRIIRYMTCIIVVLVTILIFLPPLIQKFNPLNLCGYDKYTFFEQELYDVAYWIKQNTPPTSIIISDWETQLFISSIANRIAPTSYIVWLPQLPNKIREYLLNLNTALKNHNSSLLERLLSNVPLIKNEKNLLEHNMKKEGILPIRVYLVITRNTITAINKSDLPNYAVTCVKPNISEEPLVFWLMELHYLKIVYVQENRAYVFEYLGNSNIAN